jgi:hypothetical protein
MSVECAKSAGRYGERSRPAVIKAGLVDARKLTQMRDSRRHFTALQD